MTERRREPLAAGDSAQPAAVFIAGFMGSGKTTVGSAVAKRLGWLFVDLDDEIERLAEENIARIFKESGEAEFREWEHKALSEQADLARSGQPRVVALGGGTFAFARNRKLLRAVGPTVWLDAPADVLWDRVRHASHRPLARDRHAFAGLLEARRESYSRADCRVDASRSPAEVRNLVLRLRWVRGLLPDG